MADHLSEGTDLSQVDALTVPWGGEGKGKEGRERRGGEGRGGAGRVARCRCLYSTFNTLYYCPIHQGTDEYSMPTAKCGRV